MDTFKKVLNNFYEIDEKKKQINVNLFFDNFSELIDNNFGDYSIEKFNNILFDAIECSFKEIPLSYKINLIVNINHYQNYAQKEMEKVVVNNLLLKYMSFKSQNLRRKFKSLFMTLFGAGIILISYFLGEIASLPLILTDIVNIAGTLIVWEAAYLFFLERGDARRLSLQYLKKLNSITIKGGENKAPANSISIKEELKKLL